LEDFELKFFSIDSPIYKFMCSLTNIFLLNLCWLIGCIPIVTIGTSTVAAFDVALKMADNEEGYVMKQFFQAYKKNLKQGFALEIVTAVCAYVVWLDFQLFNAVEGNPLILLIVGFITAYIFACSLIYAYPQAARYVNTVPKMMQNSFRISMRFWVRTLFLVIAVVVECAAFLWNTMMLFIGVLVGPACIIYTISAVAKPIFKIIEKGNASGESE
jgi:uncharacterized membrane protein YesL